MKSKTGSNILDVKIQNRMLVLKHIAMSDAISRVDISRITGLSKMTVGNIVTELLSVGLIQEVNTPQFSANYGRKPIMLALSENSPCICGILIKRELCQIVLSDLGGKIFFRLEHVYEVLHSKQELLDIIWSLFSKCRKQTLRKILAIGIASVGPLDSEQGIILKPPYFYGIENLPIVSIFREKTGLPVFLVNDATAGAFAEKLFGAGIDTPNFAYLHIMNGIGAGFVLNHTLYDGDSGQSGEIGHTSINFDGPFCACGNRGCLDLYANVNNMRRRIQDLAPFYPSSPLTSILTPSWIDIVTAGNQHDTLATSVLEDFCSYIAYSLTNTINLLNLSTIIVGYNSANNGRIIEDLLQHKLAALSLSAKHHPLSIFHSTFHGDAPLIGSVALIADKVFNLKLPLNL
ncbi:MAG: ROK family transcriptional regulator [Clostridiales bacterium]|nr:ROK family transcriptional regulator [Clostridiales bacterium]